MTRFGEYLKFVIKTKGFIGLILRTGMLINRFDFSGNKLQKALHEIERIGKKYGYKPCLLVPAVILRRHSRFLANLSRENFEFAIHGNTHKNYKHLNFDEQVSQIHIAGKVFEEFRVPFYGFRAPYLSWNEYTLEALQQNKLLWESDEAFLWNGFAKYVKGRHFHKRAIQLLYNPLDAEKNILIPRLEKDIVSVPIGLPDDEMLVDRYGINDSALIEKIWLESFRKSYQRGDISVIHLHPERFPMCGKAMEGLLETIKSFNPPVWITGMKEIAEWWKERSKFTVSFQSKGDRGYKVKCECSDKATILGSNFSGQCSPEYFHQRYWPIKEREFFVESGIVKPCLGVHPQCSDALCKFLRNEGFPCELSEEESGYSIFLKGYETFNRENEIDLLEKIERSTHPIVRYWLWPDGKKNAIVTTHDLDCLTLTDFFLRPFEK